MSRTRPGSPRQGFSLVELQVTLALFGLALAGLLPVLAPQNSAPEPPLARVAEQLLWEIEGARSLPSWPTGTISPPLGELTLDHAGGTLRYQFLPEQGLTRHEISPGGRSRVTHCPGIRGFFQVRRKPRGTLVRVRLVGRRDFLLTGARLGRRPPPIPVPGKSLS